ncbi:MAG: D-alanyl-D-alanine carboxypeptidase family protein [Microbacterium gubbeenense]
MTALRRPITRPFARINGLPVAVGIVDGLLALAAWFKTATGYDLIVSSGIRTYVEQVAIFTARYTLAPNGRRVYDARWWKGQLWYRISAVGTVAAPGSSNHETGRSLDLRDSGPDAGVAASFNTHRNRLLSANLHRFGFTHTGKNFGEPWHIEQLQVADPFLGQGKPQSISSSDVGQPLTGGSGAGGTNTQEDKMNKDQEQKLDKVIDLLTQRVGPHNETVPETVGRIVKRQGGSVKQKSMTTTTSEARDAAKWSKARQGGSVKDPSITALLLSVLELVSSGNADTQKIVMDRAAEIDLTLDTDADPEYDDEDEQIEPVEPIPDED